MAVSKVLKKDSDKVHTSPPRRAIVHNVAGSGLRLAAAHEMLTTMHIIGHVGYAVLDLITLREVTGP